MNFTKKNKRIFFVLLLTVVTFVSCNVIQKVANTVSDFKNLQFKLGNVNNFALNSVNLSNIKAVSDLSIADGLKLTQAVANKSLPTNFTLNIIASNPNSKATNTTANVSNFDATISKIDWQLLIDDKETVNGNVAQPIKIPSGSNSTTIPVSIGLDLFKFFNDKSYTDIMNLALAVGGANGSSSRLKLKIKPTVSIAGFPISYPNYITVVDKEFR